ncbi:hypothetical protein D3C84_806250 [compost metagenome]
MQITHRMATCSDINKPKLQFRISRLQESIYKLYVAMARSAFTSLADWPSPIAVGDGIPDKYNSVALFEQHA